MCKCCQTCLESCYWHCFEKWFCYDESIATYQEPYKKTERGIDNLAFWDSVSVIANRSVVTIQPLPEKQNNNHPQIQQQSAETKKFIPKEQQKHVTLKLPDEDEIISPRKKSTVGDLCDRQRSGSISEEASRKKTLKERRKSAAGLTLKLENNFHEIPVIRQNSMPKFYLETPEVSNSLHPNYGSERSSVLTSPVLPNSPLFNYDLRSVVQIENEHANYTPKPTAIPKRLTQVRRKLKPILHKKASTKSLPDNINHI